MFAAASLTESPQALEQAFEESNTGVALESGLGHSPSHVVALDQGAPVESGYSSVPRQDISTAP